MRKARYGGVVGRRLVRGAGGEKGGEGWYDRGRMQVGVVEGVWCG